MNEPLWEDVGKGDFRRTKVPGGWIYEHWRFEEETIGWKPYTAVFVAANALEASDNRIAELEAENEQLLDAFRELANSTSLRESPQFGWVAELADQALAAAQEGEGE